MIAAFTQKSINISFFMPLRLTVWSLFFFFLPFQECRNDRQLANKRATRHEDHASCSWKSEERRWFKKDNGKFKRRMSQIVSYLNSCHGNRAVRECGVVFNCGVNPNQALTHSLMLWWFFHLDGFTSVRPLGEKVSLFLRCMCCGFVHNVWRSCQSIFGG